MDRLQYLFPTGGMRSTSRPVPMRERRASRIIPVTLVVPS